jgi:hypothetical protein
MAFVTNEAKEVLRALNGEIDPLPWAWIAKGWRAETNPAFVYDRAYKALEIELSQ